MGDINKEYCIIMHHKMWIWIAEQIDSGYYIGIYELKKKFWRDNKISVADPSMFNYCFCCLYACSINNTDVYDNKIKGYRACKDCLVKWNSNNKNCQCCDKNSEYNILKQLEKQNRLKELAIQCRRISELRGSKD